MSQAVSSRLPGPNNPSPRAILTVACSIFFTLTTSRLAEGRDILRGGSVGTPASSSGVSNTAAATAQQTAANAARAQDTLLRTTKALQSLQALQAAARAAAKSGANNLGINPNTGTQLPDVSDGLLSEGSTGRGLKVANGVTADLQKDAASRTLWIGANGPTQSTSNGKTSVTVVQTQQQALLTWETFDIGKNTTLTFDQSKGGSSVGTWIVFNKVEDASGIPSQILGSIQASGQVYILNQNGILFGGSSQVNTHALVASSLPINTNLLAVGLMSNDDKQFLFSSEDIPKLENRNMAAFTAPGKPNTPTGEQGPVQVQAGAVIECPTTSDHSGGRVMLVGPSVTNAGTISTPDGQTILAAGKQVGVSESTDTTKRGLDVYIGKASGAATNQGIINAERGNITLAGKTVDQSGYLYSTTSVSYNGRIDLLASYVDTSTVADSRVYDSVNKVVNFYETATGLVKLGAGSVTEIVPETWSTDTLAASSLTLNSTVNIQGLAVYFGIGSVLHAPSAAVKISAGAWFLYNGEYVFGNTSGQVYFDTNSVIDVAGTQNVEASVTQNIVSVELRGTELADSTVQRTGVLKGKTVKVDARSGTPLANAQGWIDLVGRTVSELTTAGGSISISAGDSVVMQSGARMDVSGGWINYTGGEVRTTRLISGGHLYDISQASADLVYDGIYSGFTENHSKWGVTQTFTSKLLWGGHYEAGYTQGADSGAITIAASGMALDGDLYGNAVTGERQRTETPSAGSLTLKFEKADLTTGSPVAVLPSPVNVTFQTGTSQQAADAFTWDASPGALRADRVSNVILSPGLINDNGFGIVSIDNSNDLYGKTGDGEPGRITIAEGVKISAPAGGSIQFTSTNIDIEGSISIAGGAINLTAVNVSASMQANLTTDPLYDASRGNIVVGEHSTLTTAGLVVDDRVTSASRDQDPFIANGGSITIAGNDVELRKGSTLDVSGGLIITASGKRTYGSGGSLIIQSGRDASQKFGANLGGSLVLESTLLGYGGLQTVSYPSTLSNGQSLLGGNLKISVGGIGGMLTIQASAIQVGGSDPEDGTFHVSSGFFSDGGFTTFNLSGIGSETQPGLIVEPDTEISPVAKTRLYLSSDRSESDIVELPEGERSSVNLSFSALGAVNTADNNLFLFRGDLVIGSGVVINAGALASVTLSGQTVAMEGSVSAPGGEITLSGASSYPSENTMPQNALPTVYIGADTVLSTAGETMLMSDSRGYRSGVVLTGGSITVSGNIVAAPGSVLDVSGASGVLDLPLSYSGLKNNTKVPTRLAVTPTTVASDGGAITLTGKEMLFSAATLLGAAGGADAEGGSVTISSGRFYKDKKITNTSDINLTVTQSDSKLTADYLAKGASVIGSAVTDSGGNGIAGRGYFAIDSLADGGFSSVTLGGNVEFEGDVTVGGGALQLSKLTVAKGGILSAKGDVKLNAVYVTLGQPFATPMQSDELADTKVFTKNTATASGEKAEVDPTYGTGSLTVTATYIDIGNLSLQNIGNAWLYADNGDIRGDGSLDIAGHLTMRAGQIYPPTGVSFTVTAYDYTKDGTREEGSVTIQSSGTVRQTPLSAGGSLSIYASVIDQSGVLRAPFGSITLGSIDSSAAPAGAISGDSMPVTKTLTLGAGSITSVSSYDPVTGTFLTIPYGINPDGSQWYDPKGIDISTSGSPAKQINVAGANVTMDSGAQIDMRGGGDLMAYTALSGTGGTVDILSSASRSFAVIPAYRSSVAPYGAFNTSTKAAENLKDSSGQADAGYVSKSLKVGDTVYLEGSDGLAAGYYTLLPARYALLSGAVLVTLVGGAPTGTVTKSDSSNLVSGYVTSGLNGDSGAHVYQRFEVASGSVFRSRFEYDLSYANTFLKKAAEKSGAAVQRLPMDSGHLILQATATMTLEGTVLSKSVNGGRGGMIDISSPVDIVIAGENATIENGVLKLNSSDLSGMGAESLLIGGVRNDLGTTVNVQTGNLTVDNAGSSLSGPDIVLVATRSLNVASNAVIEQEGEVSESVGTLSIYRKTELASSGDSIVISQDGVPVTFTQGTPGNNTIISTRPGTITSADGTTKDFEAGTAVTVAAGASLTLSGDGTVTSTIAGTITYADGSTSALGAESAVSIPVNASVKLSGGGSLTSTRAGTYTRLDGTTETIEPNVETSIPAGATVTFSNSGTVTFSGGTGGAIPITVSDGAMLRVSSDVNAGIARSNLTTLGTPKLTIGAGAQLSGNSLILDSTYATDLSSGAVLSGQAISLNSGQISIDFGSSTTKQSTAGLVLSGEVLDRLFASANSLSLQSYSSIDIYGSGTIGNSDFEKLSLHAASIRGFDSASATLIADTILIDNSVRGNKPSTLNGQQSASGSTLTLQAGSLLLGSNSVAVEYYDNVDLKATRSILLTGTGGLLTQGALTFAAPYIAGKTGASQTIVAGGALKVEPVSGSGDADAVTNLGATLSLQGSSVEINSDILLPSGVLKVHAKNGDVSIGTTSPTRIDAGGFEQDFVDVIKYTSGGAVQLISDTGSVKIGAGGSIVLDASGGTAAGSLSVSAASGDFNLAGTLSASGGDGGSFTLDVRSLASTSEIDAVLNNASFYASRSYRVRTGNVSIDGSVAAGTDAKALSYSLAADAGDIDVTGVIDASGEEGGTISLQSFGNLTLHSGALLSVVGNDFSNSGAGGSVNLEVGSATINSGGTVSANLNALLDIQQGSTIKLGVLSNTNVAANAALGRMNGKLHLRAPITSSGQDVRVNPIEGAIENASSIVVEGFKVFTTGSAGAIDSTLRNQILAAGNTFLGSAGTTTASYTTMLNRLRGDNADLFGTNTGLDSVFSIQFGAEIVNPKGNLVLGGTSTKSTDANGDWNLATYRFGPKNTPGVLTMRAAGNLLFYNTLSDGFVATSNTAKLMTQNTALPVNAQSWSYRLTAGADFTAANFRSVLALDRLSAGSGSLLLGKDAGQAMVGTPGTSGSTNSLLNPRNGVSLYQAIRTGSGDIDISLGRNLQLLNQFATIYTAGTQVVDATRIFASSSESADFVVPIVIPPGVDPNQGELGKEQQDYWAQYSMAGGDVTITAQWDMLHQTRIAGVLKDDSERQLPVNWLYRRGYVNNSGLFGSISAGTLANKFTDASASTTWWVDFSNFFEGIAALGGGNVTLIAGHDIRNIDAAVPTNARMPKGTPDAGKLVELGGGDLTVKAGNDIDAGVYYVEKGNGTLTAGNSIHTNSTRSPSLTILWDVQDPVYENELSWLPTTLFVGKGGFDVSARGDVLLGPVANLFWVPQGIQNKFWYKTYFNTYGSSSYVNVTSLTGDITFREEVSTANTQGAYPALQVWMENELLLWESSAAYYQPWLRLAETDLSPFSITLSVLPPILNATSFSGDINIAGDLTLYPSSQGTIDLLAQGAVNGLQKVGVYTDNYGNDFPVWHSAVINLSDADPASLPGVSTPLTNPTVSFETFATVTESLTLALEEAESILGANGTLSTKQARHAASLLHLEDSTPLHIYAGSGDISGFTLFSAKSALISAANDITDVGIYVQNLLSTDATVISAGRDILLYYPKSTLHSLATADGNLLDSNGVLPTGDVQIAGPGTLEILAGRDLDLGTGKTPDAANDTNLGIVTVGNARNPYLSSEGADVLVAAGLGSALGTDALDFDSFISKFMDPAQSSTYASAYLPEIVPLLKTYLADTDLTGASSDEIWSAFETLGVAQRRAVALNVFFRILRDAGRNKDDASSTGYQYQSGYEAIEALFPGNSWAGDILLTSREIKTKAGSSTKVSADAAVSGTNNVTIYSGGNITMLAPGGKIDVGLKLQAGQDQGVLTEHGGNISMFSDGSVSVGLSRIFTLRGGDLIIWSTSGDIAAGSSSKTIKSAPPTRVIVDPQSADTQVDFGGLYTGGGIGVLASVSGVPAGQVDLIAPSGNIDAGDAGIRSTGDLHVAALQVLNASNIQVSGVSTGTPAAAAAPNISGMTSVANTAAAATNSSVNTASAASQQTSRPAQDLPSVISVEVVGYGGGEGD